MRITPLDVRKQEFRRAVRGFDCEEVRAFLSTLADEYETVLIDNKQLRERVVDQEDKIAEYKNLERTLRDTLMTAERLMQDTRERSNKEGELIIQDARLQAKRILEECRVRTEELRGELSGLRKEKETYLARFKTLAETQIQFVESHRSDFDDLDKRLVGMVDEVIEGLGAKAATTAVAATAALPSQVPQMPPTPQATVVEPAPQQAPAQPQPISAAPPTGDVVDEWRNYEHLDAPEKASAPVPAPEPVLTQEPVPTREPVVATPPAVEVAEANPWRDADGNGGEWKAEPAPTEAAPAAAAVEVELATMGIPLVGPQRPDDAEQAVANLTEEVEKSPVASW